MHRVSPFIKTKQGIVTALFLGFACFFLLISFLSSGISFLFQVISVLCFLFVIFYWSVILSKRDGPWKNPAKVLKWCITVSVLVLMILFVIIEINIFSDHRGDDEIPDSVQTVIVLGCKVNGETPSMMLRYRLECALQWLNDRPDSVAVLCGGQGPGEDITEAEAMKRWLTGHGIEEHRLIKEDTSTNTRENIRNAEHIINANSSNQKEVAVITTGFHLFRSKKICNSEGFVSYGVAAKMPEIPFFHLNYYCREFASVIKMYLQEISA